LTLLIIILTPKGQEETRVDIEDGITFTPFNMKEELEEGHFDSEGMYIFKKEQVIHKKMSPVFSRA